MNRTAKWLNNNGKMAFARFKTVRSVLALAQPFIRSIITFLALARKAYTYVSTVLRFAVCDHTHMHMPRQNGKGENHVNGMEQNGE